MSTLKGNVEVVRASGELHADTVLYDRQTQILDSAGNIEYWNPDIYATGSQAHFELDSNQGWINDVHYRLVGTRGRGEAATVSMGGRNVLLLEKATYSTCPPGPPDWLFLAKSIKLDRLAQAGTARNVKVLFKGVPIFYSPYLSFPLSHARKTGFLTPSFGSSAEVGAEVTVPFYWNIAPQMDATIGVREMSKRGPMLQGQFRYLLPRGEGQAALEYMPKDRQLGESRGLYTFRHAQDLGQRWHTDLNLNHVTDHRYFEQLGTNLEVSSTSYLERRADLTYQGDAWGALGRLQGYQTINDNIAPADRPYHRVPQLVAATSLPQKNRRLNLSLYGEFVRFERDFGVTGNRIDLNPAVSFPIRTPATFLVPRLALRHTRYALENVAPGVSTSPKRTTPTASLDSGVYFDRELQIGSRAYTQTLEPRLYYLYVPFRNQSNLPVFDTAAYTFNFAQLFREERFSGADRVGDANQATLALTTRLLDKATGDERVRLSIGQIHYFKDRKVTLPGEPVERTRSSDLVAEIAAQVARAWQVRAGFQQDTSHNLTQKSALAVRYQPDSDRVLNLGYRFVRGAVEQADVSTRWPLSNHLAVVGRFNYALPEKRVLESFGGLEYESCCWALRTVVRRYLNSVEGTHLTGIFLQLELKGLGSLGQKTRSFLQQQIPGYDNAF